ncbi:cytochrome P450 [Podospora conica]|nr:cytochrome P450 [Schizothecium conicum]
MLAGTTVRIAPNELSFTTPSSWKDIHGFRKGHGIFVKSQAYDAAAFASQTRSVVNERDPAEHARMRKMLSPGFSDRSLRDQWPIINDLVDGLVDELTKRAASGNTVDMTKVLSAITFDISTSLGFGRSFGAVHSEKEHPWMVFIGNGARAMGEAAAIQRFPWIQKLILALKPPQMIKMIKELEMHEAMCTEMVKKRQDEPSDRPDILGLILEASHKAEEEFPTPFIAAQLSDVVIAGAETTGTALATATHYVMRDRVVLERLRGEIRERFSRVEDITPETTANLPYVNAVLNEALRVLPPVPWVASRLVPLGGDTVDGHFLPTGTLVSTNTFAASRSPLNFEYPAEFRPERWISNPHDDKLGGAQPFGLGTRGCIGKSLALTEMRLIMAKVHFLFDVEAVNPDLDWIDKTVFRLLWAKPPLMARLTLAHHE